MANGNAPRGLVPVRGVSSQYVTGGLRAYYHDSGNATAIFVGDPVTQTGASTAVAAMGGAVLPNVVQGASGEIWSGVVVAILPTSRDSLPYGPASTGFVVLVDDDPNTLFEIQDVGTGTPLTINDIGLNINISVGSGNTATGWSGVVFDNASEASTNTLDLKIVDFVNRVDNEAGQYAKYLVRINRHRFANQIAGV